MPRAPISLGQLSPVEKKAALSPAMAQARRMALMDALESGNLTRPLGSGSIVEGLARGAEGFLRTRAARGERESAERKRGDQARTIAQALEAMQGQEVEGPLRPGEARPMTPGDPRMAAAVLAQNPDTAGMGLSLAMADIKAQQQARAKIAEEQRRFANQKALKATPGPSLPGRDEPLSPEVYDQRLAIARAQAEAKEEGKSLGEARSSLPAATEKAQQALTTIGQLRDHKGRVHGLSTLIPARPGTPEYAFRRLAEQAQGQVFLNAYETLKGGGQITEVEGRKAEQAVARLDIGQSREEYNAALSDLETIIKRGLERAKRRAGVEESPADGSTPSAGDLDAFKQRLGLR